jgi:hypothetical protein
METYSTLIICELILILIKSVSSCMTLVGKPGNGLPSFERPKLIYTRIPAKSNCVEKFMSKSNNQEMIDFYEDFNVHLRVFLNQTKSNKMPLSAYQMKAALLTEEYNNFYRNISKYKGQCMAFTSYKNLYEITARMKNIMPYFTKFEMEQYNGKFLDHCCNILYSYH